MKWGCIQQVVDLYKIRQERNISIGKVIEALVHNDKEIASLYNEVKGKQV